MKSTATRDQCSSPSRPLLGLGVGYGAYVWCGGLSKGGRAADRWWLVLSRRTTPADALSAKLQVELISSEGGKGWGRLAQESGQGPRARPGWPLYPCDLSWYPVPGWTPGPRRHPCSSALAVSRALWVLTDALQEIIQCVSFTVRNCTLVIGHGSQGNSDGHSRVSASDKTLLKASARRISRRYFLCV